MVFPALTRIRQIKRIGILLVSAICYIGSANASTVTFAQFTEVSGGQDFALTNQADGSQTLSGSSQVQFLFQNVGDLPAALSGNVLATLTINATSTGSVSTSTIFGQPYVAITGFFGTFSFTLNSPFGGKTNLLTGEFLASNGPNEIGSTLFGPQGGNSASFGDSTRTDLSEIKFSSDFLNFTSPKSENFSLSFSSVEPSINVSGSNINNFAAAIAGTAAADPTPLANSEVPEGASFATIGLGLLLIGALRRRRKGLPN